ncbi:HxlR family transcriptional regulator [Paenibacillus pabuli]|uniref:HxlR family transcriptional regulator n=1 Tax=Paenibacillus pabuli TaxID=1472 RepID=A0A855XZ54_9BACL|nr:HxlR family transcriptional regulator [Paenibacillus pabuli]PXW08894.1 HxlR family transcriptional regulator [Paenibacillus taichungensis]
MHILFWLWIKETLRYGELKRALDGITHKMLSSQLKELEADQLIIRTEYPQLTPKVEYSLSLYFQ